MIKCIASDMDGTLLNQFKEISVENYRAITFLQENGIEFVIVTGRAYDEAIPILQQAGISCPMICSNGAYTCDELGNEIFSSPLLEKDAHQIAELLDKENIYYEVSTNIGVFAREKESAAKILTNIYRSIDKEMDAMLIQKKVMKRLSTGIKNIDNYDHLLRDPLVKVFKLLVFSENIRKLQVIKKELNESQNVAVTSSAIENIEISHAFAQKGFSLERYLKKVGISTRETMVIGDSPNDLSMFAKAGLSVAMGNANHDIKKMCDLVTDTNENNGVAKAISMITGVPI